MDIVMTACRFLAALLSVYSLLIWIRVLFSWVRVPLERNPILFWLARITDPYLDLFKGIRWMRLRTIDFTPVAALAVLSLAQGILGFYGTYGRMTPGMMLAMAVRTLDGYLISPLCVFAVILLGVRLVFCYHRSPRSLSIIAFLDSLDGGILDFYQKLCFGTRAVSVRTVVWTSFLATLFLSLALHWGVGALCGLLVRL